MVKQNITRGDKLFNTELIEQSFFLQPCFIREGLGYPHTHFIQVWLVVSMVLNFRVVISFVMGFVDFPVLVILLTVYRAFLL